MKYIRSIKKIDPASSNGKTILYMHGYRGATWQASRHLSALTKQGYKVYALDFVDILKPHSPVALIELMNEVEVFVRREGLANDTTTIIGISLGGLVGFNMIKRYKELKKLFIITGGDMTHIPTKRALRAKWGLSQEELSAAWSSVNIYTPVGGIRGKHIRMLLPERDKLINPEEVVTEINKHSSDNDIQLTRTRGGHFRTIISETILWPKRSLDTINNLAKL